MVELLDIGFADPVVAAQAHFRAVLRALAEPGLPVPLDGELPAAAGDRHGAGLALLLALADYETPVWLDQALDRGRIGSALRFHCGCPIADEPGRAAFAFLSAPENALPLDRFSKGTAEYPDRSATLVIAAESFAAGRPVRLEGPGIAAPRELRVAGAGERFWEEVRVNHGLFPEGVDLVFAGGREIIGLPRSASVEFI
jgi:alpha-D-ribose 1-methylphosphonate 5-triphosphate synthase subunit PhnH